MYENGALQLYLGLPKHPSTGAWIQWTLLEYYTSKKERATVPGENTPRFHQTCYSEFRKLLLKGICGIIHVCNIACIHIHVCITCVHKCSILSARTWKINHVGVESICRSWSGRLEWGVPGKGHEGSFWIGAKLYTVIYLGVPRYVNPPKQMDWLT